MRILIAPGHYYFTDKLGSEPLWAVEIVRAISSFADVDVIVGVADIATPLPANVRIFPLFKSRSANALVEFFKRSVFYLLVTGKGLMLMQKNQYSVTHHLLPFSLATFNPLIILAKNKKIIGPLQAPYETSNLADLDLALVGKKINPLLSKCLQLVYLVAIKLVEIFSRWTLNSANVLVATSDLAKKYYQRYSTQPIVVIAPPSDVQAQVRIPKHKQILCIGALVPRKGQEILIQALAKIDSAFKLTLVGEGPDKIKLRALVNKLGLEDRVTFVGQISHQQTGKYYSEASILCLPSLQDSYPTVLIEALAWNLPIVATDVGSAAEIVGTNGIIVPRNNVESLAEALQKINSIKLSNNRYAKRFSKAAIASQYQSVYQ